MLRLMEEGQQGHERPARARRRQDRPLQRRQRDDGCGQAVLRDRAALDGRPGQAGRGASAPCSATTCSSSPTRRSARWAGKRCRWRSPKPATTASTIPSGAAIPTSISGSSPISSPCAGSRTLLDKTEGLDERTRQRAEFYLKQLVERAVALQLPADQPRGAARDVPVERPEPRAGHGQSCARPGEVRRPAQHQPDRRRGLRGRPQRRDRARQGRVPERHPAAHPVRAVDRQGARAAAADRAAVDQQVLHPRSRPAEILHPLRGRRRASRCSWCAGSTRTSASRTRPSRTT